jgi:DNA-binding response OmpR family regulator
MPALDFGLPLRFSPKPSASPSHLGQRTATSGPKLIATDGPRKLAKRTYALSKRRQELPIPAKHFELLGVLVQAKGKPVRKDATLQEVWPNTNAKRQALVQTVYLVD